MSHFLVLFSIYCLTHSFHGRHAPPPSFTRPVDPTTRALPAVLPHGQRQGWASRSGSSALPLGEALVAAARQERLSRQLCRPAAGRAEGARGLLASERSPVSLAWRLLQAGVLLRGKHAGFGVKLIPDLNSSSVPS